MEIPIFLNKLYEGYILGLPTTQYTHGGTNHFSNLGIPEPLLRLLTTLLGS